jgi:beta-xylosidase
MKKHPLLAVLGLCVALCARGAEPSAPLYSNPVIPGDTPDPSVIRVGRDYWATATSSEWGPFFPIYHSTDLVNWEQVGSVFPHRPAWATGNFWAPEISAHKGKYYVYYVGRRRGGPLSVAVASASRPAGPYTDHGVLVSQEAGSIDPVPVTDEQGERHLIWKEDGNSRRLPTVLWIQKLSEDGFQLVGERRELFHNDASWEGAVVEGPFVVRHDGWYYLFYSGNGCCGGQCNYALGVARARALLGPWEKAPGNPLLAGNNHWKCPGHGSIVQDDIGRRFLLYHAYSAESFVYTGREGLLDEVNFAAGEWPSIREGRGPSSEAPSPAGAVQRRRGVAFFDDFREASPRPGWQWPQDNEPTYTFTRSRQGQLLLRPAPLQATNRLGAVLARSATSANYRAATSIDLTSLERGGEAGLSAYGDAANCAGISAAQGAVTVWRNDQGRYKALAQVPLPAAARVHLRITARQGHSFRCEASLDGREWRPVGDTLEGRSLPPWDRAMRVALTSGGAPGAEGRFNYLRIDPLP